MTTITDLATLEDQVLDDAYVKTGTWWLDQRRDASVRLAFPYVEAGACWLDQRRPGWHREINLEELNLANSCDCVLGQFAHRYHLDGEFFSVLLDIHPVYGLLGMMDGTSFEDLNPALHVLLLTLEEAQEMGFSCNNLRGDPFHYDDLTAAWRTVIRLRRRQEALPSTEEEAGLV